jgi:hypothetical protein
VTKSEARPEPDGPAGGGRRRLILAGMTGNVMEWYDFSVYGDFAATLGRHIFPSEDAMASLLVAFEELRQLGRDPARKVAVLNRIVHVATDRAAKQKAINFLGERFLRLYDTWGIRT